MPSMLEEITAQPGDKVRELVKDAVALTGAERVPDVGELVLWRIPGHNGSFETAAVVRYAISMIGKAGWE